MPLAPVVPHTARPTCESTDVWFDGRACVLNASHETPMSSAIALPAIIARVVHALRACGARKAPTPLATVSMPVRALHPDAKLLKSTMPVAEAAIPRGMWLTTSARCSVP